MLLLIDWGNTYLKLIKCHELTSNAISASEPQTLDDINLLAEYFEPSINQVLVCSVRNDQDNQLLLSLLKSQTDNIYFAATQAKACDVTCAYSRPQDMGVDRWAGLIAAHQIHSNTGVVSVGSAVTLDILIDGQHLGGQIVPGHRLLIQSLQQTGRVRPVADPELTESFSLGTSTTECVTAGIQSLFTSYLTEAIVRSQQQYGIKHFIFSGGGGEFWTEKLSYLAASIEYQPKLVFEGLACLYQHAKQME